MRGRADAQQMRWLLDYTAQQASGIAAWQRDTDHIEKAFVFGGMPARSGVTAALLVQARRTGVEDIFSGADNFFWPMRRRPNRPSSVDELGGRYEIARTNIKKWTVGSPIQAPLDALDLLRRRRASPPPRSGRWRCGWPASRRGWWTTAKCRISA